MSRQVTIFCDGGLGNRLGSLVGGLYVANHVGTRDITVCWPANNWCGSYFQDLFANQEFQIISPSINDIFVAGTDQAFVVHENQTGADLGLILPQSGDSLDRLTQIPNSIVYYHNKIAPYMDTQLVWNMANQLRPADSIKQQVQEFCKRNQINKSVTGLHLRKTENYKLDEGKLFKRVQATPGQRYFVCSDDQATEQRFATLPNVCHWPKTSYVSKLIDGDWRAETVDADGRRYNYNINRPRQSVIEAFVDMLILSQTNIQFTVKSSFSRFAEVFANTGVLHDQG
jgi:hypothetical protein